MKRSMEETTEVASPAKRRCEGSSILHEVLVLEPPCGSAIMDDDEQVLDAMAVHNFQAPAVREYMRDLIDTLEPELRSLPPHLKDRQQGFLGNILRWQVETGIRQRVRDPQAPCIQLSSFREAVNILVQQDAVPKDGQYSSRLIELAASLEDQQVELRPWRFLLQLHEHAFKADQLDVADMRGLHWSFFCFCRLVFEHEVEHWQRVCDEPYDWADEDTSETMQALEARLLTLGIDGHHEIYLHHILEE